MCNWGKVASRIRVQLAKNEGNGEIRVGVPNWGINKDEPEFGMKFGTGNFNPRTSEVELPNPIYPLSNTNP